MSEYKQVDKVIFFYINMFSVINERKKKNKTMIKYLKYNAR